MAARRRILGGLAATVTLVCVAVPARAPASPTQESIFMDDNLLLFRGNEVTDKTLGELKALGVDRVRVSVPWRAFAPDHRSAKRPATFTDPTDSKQYDPISFDLHDHLLRVADRLGIKVLLNVTGGAPLWATGTVNKHKLNLQYKPSPKGFGQFVEMLAKRYDGTHTDENQGGLRLPKVTAWSIWNEPNASALLQPQWERSKRTHHWVPVAGRIYRDLARAALGALQRTGHGSDTILLGETAPRGLNVYGRTRSMRPLTFLRAVFCMDPKTGRPLKGAVALDLGCRDWAKHGPLAVNGYAHHPYSITSAPDVADPAADDVTLADQARLATLLDAAAALHRIPAGLPFWWTEFGWQTNPPDPVRGVSPENQARWIAQAEKITRADGRTVALTQFLLRDDPPRDEAGATLERKWGTYQTGLEDVDGKPKPAYDAYRLPLVATQTAPGKVSLWGFVRPFDGARSANVQVQFAPSGSADFQAVGGALAIDPGSRQFTVDVTPPAAGTYRFQWSPPAPPAVQPSGLGALLGQKPVAQKAQVFTSVTVAVASR